MIFVDSGAWYGSIVPKDENYEAARDWFANNPSERLITTDYVVAETLTLFRARGEMSRALLMAERFFDGELTEIIYLTRSDFDATVAVFKKFSDHKWSFYGLFE